MRSFFTPITFRDIAPVAAVLLAVTGFYFNTNNHLANTDSHLGEHDKQIVELRAEVAQAKQKSLNVGETDRSEREKARSEFLVRAEKTADGIGELNKRMAVQETLQATMSNTLNKISDQLERWGNVSRMPMQHR